MALGQTFNTINSLNRTILASSAKAMQAIATYSSISIDDVNSRSDKFVRALKQLSQVPEFQQYALEVEKLYLKKDLACFTVSLLFKVLANRQAAKPEELESILKITDSSIQSLTQIKRLIAALVKCVGNEKNSLEKTHLLIDRLTSLCSELDNLYSATNLHPIVRSLRSSDLSYATPDEMSRVAGEEFKDEMILGILRRQVDLQMLCYKDEKSHEASGKAYFVLSRILNKFRNQPLLQKWVTLYVPNSPSQFQESHTISYEIGYSEEIKKARALIETGENTRTAFFTKLEKELVPDMEVAEKLDLANAYIALIPEPDEELSKDLSQTALVAIKGFYEVHANDFSDAKKITEFVTEHKDFLSKKETCNLLKFLAENPHLGKEYIDYYYSEEKKLYLAKVARIITENQGDDLIKTFRQIGRIPWKEEAISFLLENWNKISSSFDKEELIRLVTQHKRGIQLAKDYLEYHTAHDSIRAKLTLVFALESDLTKLHDLRVGLKRQQDCSLNPIIEKLAESPTDALRLLESLCNQKVETKLVKNVSRLEQALSPATWEKLKGLKRTAGKLKWGIIQQKLESFIECEGFEEGTTYFLAQLRLRHCYQPYQDIVADTTALNWLIALSLLPTERSELTSKMQTLVQNGDNGKRAIEKKVNEFRSWMSSRIAELKRAQDA